jgi:hypothetical protein
MGNCRMNMASNETKFSRKGAESQRLLFNPPKTLNKEKSRTFQWKLDFPEKIV